MKKVLTIIFDGFGLREEEQGNAIKAAAMKNFNDMWNEYPHSSIEASGKYVGLGENQFGNSEVGHMTIGAGRLIKQNEMIVTDFLDNDYIENEEFQKMLEQKNKSFHIMGLLSDGNVHSSIEHYIKLFHILVKNEITKIHFHLITDGRDTDIHSANKYIDRLQERIKEYNVGDITSVCGRYYAMDRDDNYDRTKVYYDLIVNGIGISSLDVKKSIDNLYEKEITDEFMKPIITNSTHKIDNDDIIIWMNYRADRAKQILEALINEDFNKFPSKKMKDLKVYSFLPVDTNIKTINFTEPSDVTNPLGLYLSYLDLTQARISESEKYPHVTYFFDGGYDGDINKCDKFEIASPDVKTYDLKPEMSAVEVTKKVIKSMEQDYDFILVNFANPDMVGHTGDFDAAVNACKAIDICLGKILETADDNFYKVILLADHGNADIMSDTDGNVITTHTTNQVPFIIRDKNISLKEIGDLTMVAPTILNYMDIAVPKEMQETDILIK